MQKQEPVSASRFDRLSEFFSKLLRPSDAISEAETLATLDDLSLATPRRIDEDWHRRELPVDLIEAFSPQPLPTDDNCLVAREDVIEKLTAGIAGWRQDRPMLLAVIATSGCGLTSLLSRIKTLVDVGEKTVFHTFSDRPETVADTFALCREWFELEATPNSIDEAVKQILLADPCVMVLDHGHCLYSRLMGRRDGLLTLGSIMVATQARHMWVLGCEKQAWRRQCHANQAERYYDEVIELAPFDRESLSEIINRRIEGAGYTFEQVANAPKHDQTKVPDELMRSLWRISGGHPGLAFFHLMRALRVGEGKTLGFAPLSALDYSPLRDLKRKEMLTLAEISAHGSLNAEEHQAIFRMGQQTSGIVLNHLLQISLITVDGENSPSPRYRLEALHAGAINAHLLRVNYLY